MNGRFFLLLLPLALCICLSPTQLLVEWTYRCKVQTVLTNQGMAVVYRCRRVIEGQSVIDPERLR